MKKISLFITVALSAMGGIQAQAFYEFNNRHLSQSHLWNPGFMPQYKATLSVGQTYFGANLVGTTLNGLFGSTETPLQTVTRLIGEDEKQLGVDLYQQTDVFHFGFRSKKSYFSINSTLVNEAAIRVPKDLLGLAFIGNGAFIEKDADIDFSGNQIRSYLKNTFSYGRFITNELSLGMNASLINGISDLNLEQARFGIGTDTGTASIYSLNLNGAIKGRASLLGVDVQDALNDSTYDANQTVMDQLNQISMGTNQGYALGFGAVYRFNEKFRVSGSIQNLGNILWNLGAQEIIMNESKWIWNGLDTNQINNLNDDIAQQLQDTFLNKFDVTGAQISSYTTQLKPRYTIGAEFLLFPRTHIQAFGGYGFGINGDKTFVSSTIHQELGEWIDLRLGYSLYDISNPVHRISLGLSLNLGPIQVFGSVNDVLGIINYGSASATSGMIGLNINIGKRNDRDYDEVPDKKDSCYKIFGVISNNGCPYGFLGGSMSNDENEDVLPDEVESEISTPERETTPEEIQIQEVIEFLSDEKAESLAVLTEISNLPDSTNIVIDSAQTLPLQDSTNKLNMDSAQIMETVPAMPSSESTPKESKTKSKGKAIKNDELEELMKR